MDTDLLDAGTRLRGSADIRHRIGTMGCEEFCLIGSNEKGELTSNITHWRFHPMPR